MKVIIERIGSEGKVITATWSGSKFSEQLVWDSSGTLYTNYDDGHDILYISRGPADAEYAEDDPQFASMWLRKRDTDDAPQGVTIFGLKKLPIDQRDELFTRVASFLGVTKDEIGLRANIAFVSR
jgi:hypothetical protein